ncbi:hypothetical protein GCM10011297_13700 [Bacterioplanes sanyensis]|nr:hypothetical protein GCM10011297_13700 [Bacterioplanes sanyensis]
MALKLGAQVGAQNFGHLFAHGAGFNGDLGEEFDNEIHAGLAEVANQKPAIITAANCVGHRLCYLPPVSQQMSMNNLAHNGCTNNLVLTEATAA